MKRSRAVLLGVVAALVAAAVVGFADETTRGDHSVDAASDGPRISRVAGEVRVRVPDRTYMAVRGKKLTPLGKPVLVGDRQVSVPEVDTDPKALGRAVLYQVDRNGTISDVMVLSRTRNRHGQLMPLQWLASKSGVEFVWPADGKRPWTVTRAGKIVEKQAHGYYIDNRPLRSPTRYEVKRSTPTTVTYKGRTTTEESSTTYVLIAPVYDDGLIGQPFDKAVGDRPTPPNPLKTASVGEDVGVDSFAQRRRRDVSRTGEPPSVEFARVFSTREEACAELQRRHPAPVGLQAAMADSKLLGPTLVGSREDIRMVGVSTCGESHVVIVGVTGAETQVPARGPQGTPIIAFLQPAFHATG